MWHFKDVTHLEVHTWLRHSCSLLINLFGLMKLEVMLEINKKKMDMLCVVKHHWSATFTQEVEE